MVGRIIKRITKFFKKYNKEYNILKNIFFRGGIGTVILFFLFTINNTVLFAFWAAIIMWILFVLTLLFIIYAEEIYKPKILLKRLKSKRYEFLINHDFQIIDNSFLAGNFKGFQIHIYPKTQEEKKKKNIKYEIIQCFYNLTEPCDRIKKESIMSGNYFLGNLLFEDLSVRFIPYDWKDPDFEDILNSLIPILIRDDLIPRTFLLMKKRDLFNK